MNKVCMPFIIGFSSFSMASVLAADAGFVPVTRALSSDSSANISSSSSFEACNMHFSDFKYPALSDDEYFQKNHQYRSGLACILVKHMKQDMMYSKLTTRVPVLVPLIIKLFMTTKKGMEINSGCYICEKWEGKSSISISGKKQRCIWFYGC
ncbi:hypothetical protein [Pantoea agglomerans]|uniref:hypothetical protein n=1 Tax=Enterobacter agglomerans TaxID=549 RepID=UPI001FCE78A2|nr:hypothetical protein [Pantoea agglomerans]